MIADSGPPSAWWREVPGDPAAFRPAAADVAAAAIDLGVPVRRREDLTLAVHEVLVNAWEHGHLGAPEPRIRVEVAPGDDSTVTVRVVDAGLGGRWDPDVPPATADPDRGRGLAIVQAAVDEVAVGTGEHGTVVSLTVGSGNTLG